MSENNRVMPAPPSAQVVSQPPAPAPELGLLANQGEPPKAPSPLEAPQPPPLTKIDVVATRVGYFKNMRRKPGDQFKVDKFEQLGEWMSCLNPVLEKQRLEYLEDKKKKFKAEAKAGK